FTRMSVAKWLRQGFTRAQQAIENGEDDITTLYRTNNEDLIPLIEVLEGKMPLRLHAHRADDIITAIRIAKDFNIDLSIEHGTEAFKVLSHVKESGFPVTVGLFMGELGKYEVRDMKMESSQILHDEGVLISISTDHPFNPIQYLAINAAVAVKHGLNEMAALRAITI